MRSRLSLAIVLLSAAIGVGVLYVAYRLIDPLPPRHFAIAVAGVGSSYETYAKQYQGILARYGVELEIRHSASALENRHLLRDPASGVQAALTTFGITKKTTMQTPYIHSAEHSTPHSSSSTGTRSL